MSAAHQKTPTIHFARGLELPADILMQPIALLGNRGGGKTYGGMKLFEIAYEAGVQCGAVDPIGKWWALRLGADGKSRGLNVYIFGGKHADFPIQSDKGAFVARVVVERRIHFVLDLSQMRKGERRRFLTEFFEEFYLLKKREDVVHACVLFLEEAHALAPQKPQADEARMLGAVEDLVREGRNAGIGVALMDQRPATVNKNLLALVEVLIILRTTFHIDRKVYEEWIVQKGADVNLGDELPSLKAGHGYLYAPELGIFTSITILTRKTYDSSATAKVGAAAAAVGELTPVDMDVLREAMAAVVEEAEKDDPKALRKRISELEAQLRRAPTAVPAAPPPKPVEVPVLNAADRNALSQISDMLDEHMGDVARVADQIKKAIADLTTKVDRFKIPAPVPGRATLPTRPSPKVAPVRAPAAPRGDGDLSPAAQRMLEVIAGAHPEPMSRARVALLAGYKESGGGFRNTLSELSAGGFVTKGAGAIGLSDAGVAYFTGTLPPPKTQEEVRAMWRAKLSPAAWRMLQVLIDAHLNWMPRADLAAKLDYEISGGGFRNTLSEIASNGLVEKNGGELRANPDLIG